jgi:multiple sugar transport system substrate-binding protein
MSSVHIRKESIMTHSRPAITFSGTFFLLACMLFSLAACGGDQNSSSGSGSKPYAGTTLRVLLAVHPWADAIKPLLADFQQQTGITVKIESYGENQLTQKLTVEFVSGSSDIDVFMTRPLQEARLFVKNNWYTDLNTYVKDAQKTPASYASGDFLPRATSTVTIKGTLSSIPIVVEHEVLYYRKDLFQQAGLHVPATLDELQQDAAKLTIPGKQYGFIARGMQAAAVTQLSSYLYSEGGDWFDPTTHKATLNSPAAIAALTLYGKLLHDYAPAGTLNMNWPQAAAVFAQGKVAMYTDADALYSNILDPTKSQVADKTGIAPFPAGPAGSVPYSVCSWGLAMSATAPHKDAAWEFIKWATNPQTTLKIQGKGSVPEARASIYQQPAGIASFPKDFISTSQAEASGRQYDRPYMIQVVQARDIIGTAIVASIEGKDVTAAAQQANTQLQALLDKEAT